VCHHKSDATDAADDAIGRSEEENKNYTAVAQSEIDYEIEKSVI
jgi:POT family proton-dependent oligopeptide transporter